MYNTVIIGAGSIASKDWEKKDKYSDVLSHAHACWKHDFINLIGIIDIDIEKAKKAAKQWNTEAYQFLAQIQESIDIIIIAVSTENHLIIFEEILQLNLKPKLIICEKPFCNNLWEAEIIKEKFKEYKIMINYSRRYLLSFQSLAKQLQENKWGKIYNCTLQYTRGLKREASHFIDLCNWWFGKFQNGKILSNYSINDFSDTDLTRPVYLQYEKCPNVFLCPLDGRKTSLFEINIITEKGKINIVYNGESINYYLTKQEEIWGRYKYIPKNIDYVDFTDIYNHPLHTINSAIEYIHSNYKNEICTIEDGIKVHQVYKFLGI